MNGPETADPAWRLYGVPPPQLLEAPSSWLCRIALHQGELLGALLQALGLSPERCLDVQFCAEAERLAPHLGGIPERMALSVLILRRALQLGPAGHELLHTGEGAGPSAFRYCPECFGCQREPHVPVHWRLAPWVYCPVHECLLSERCRHCGSPSSLPFDLVKVSRQGTLFAALSRCGRCGLAMTDPVSELKLARHSDIVRESDWRKIDNGRAFVAALQRGYFECAGRTRALDAVSLNELIRRRLFPGSWPAFRWDVEREVSKAAAARGWIAAESEGRLLAHAEATQHSVAARRRSKSAVRVQSSVRAACRGVRAKCLRAE
jgi:hypothetical protein